MNRNWAVAPIPCNATVSSGIKLQTISKKIYSLKCVKQITYEESREAEGGDPWGREEEPENPREVRGSQSARPNRVSNPFR